ncbi:hypothetical protein Acsp04_55680 [Actinomadura sp. NBRC 104425]|uniref:tetratricopeptide repeat protein n=1 Tax=Actinomadura sp. NBRC 104425 TaxID=3032204 RepID=UPI0024A20307|nr:tetratricopeptide repeat protein [Actinomadura sp. NBRC 104425]GLZ15333.1 hypothetical protein Acsp04_55680 [Actinomadura sp. NBRC 104425]
MSKQSAATTGPANGPDNSEPPPNKTAIFLISQGEYQRAHTMLTTAVAIIEAASGPDHPDAAIILGNLAASYRALGRAAEALDAIKRAEQIASVALGTGHPTMRALQQYAAHLKALFGDPD